MRTTSVNSEVIVVIDGKPKKGTIVEAISQGAARIELGDHSTIQASYSLSGEDGSFHYPDEADAVKEAKSEAKSASRTDSSRGEAAPQPEPEKPAKK